MIILDPTLFYPCLINGSVKYGFSFASTCIIIADSVYMFHFFFLFFSPVTAMNSLFVSLQYPQLIGWLAMGGDPCSEAWQGVGCVFSNITSLYALFVSFLRHLISISKLLPHLVIESFFLQKTKWLEFRGSLEQRFQ